MPEPDFDSLTEVKPAGQLPDFGSLKPVSTATASSALLLPLSKADLSTQGSYQPSQFSSGLPPGTPNADNPDFAFTKALSDPQTGIIAKGQKPFIPIPSAKVNPNDSKITAVGKEVYNIAKSIPEFIESPLGIATLPIAAEARAGKLIAGAFGADALKNVGEGIIQTHKDWDTYTPAQKAAAVTDIVGNGAMAALLGKAALGKGKIAAANPDATAPKFQNPDIGINQPPTPPPNPPVPASPSLGTTESSISPPVKAIQDVAVLNAADFSNYLGKKGLTRTAWDVGQSVKSPEEVAELKNQQDAQAQQFQAAKSSKDLTAMANTAIRGQFFREAYEAATGTGSAGEGLAKENPDYKPPFPSSESAKAAPVADKLPTTTRSVGEQVSGGGAEPSVESVTPLDKNGTPIVPQKAIPAKKPALQPLGADLASQPRQGSPTAMKYRLIDQERQQRGLEPLAKPASVSDQSVMDKATAEIDRDPSLPDKLVSELKNKPRSIDAWERMVLLLHKIDLRHEYEKSANEAAQAYDDSKEFPDRKDDMLAANVRTAQLSDQLTDLETASRVSGSEQGRGLRALRVMANEDYSLASLETQRRAAKGGAPLTDGERAELKKVADDYKKANDELQSHLDKSRASEIEANQRLDEILRQPKPEPIAPHIRALAEKIISASEGLANSARERIKARRAQGRLMTGLDPTDLADHAIVGTDYLLHGIRDFAEWSKSMVSEFGDYVKPHLQQIFDASIKGENAKLPKTPEQKTSVKKAVKNMTSGERASRIKQRIKTKLAAGDKDSVSSDVQRLARVLVEGGIKDREELISAVHDVLKNIDPEITRRDAMDAISGYGDFKQLSKDEVSVRLRGMKGEMQQIAKLEDMAKGVPPSKTGIERRTPTDEERKLIRAVNESKVKFQVPITDPTTQLKSALDTRKIQLQRQIEAMQEKMDSGDFSKPERRKLVLDRRAQELQAEKERITKKFKRQQSDYQKANALKSSKALDLISNLRRFSVLSGVNVVGKLAAYSATKIPTIGATEAIGGALGKIPGVSKVFSKAPSEGGFQVKAIANAIAKGLTQGFVDAYKTATKGQSDLRAAFSNRVESGHEWYNFFQTVHEVVKSPLRRAAFELSLAKRMEFAANHGADISDPMTQLALAKDAYLDSDRALLLENNRLASGIRGLFKQLESKDKKTGQVPLSGKIAATAGRVELPILSVPLNYVKQAMTSAFGLVTGSLKLRRAFADGIENLKPEEADAIARHLKYGTIGGAMLLYGFIDGYKNGANGTFGGFYQPGEKRKDDQAGVGGIRVDAHNIPGLFLHNPVLAVAQMGHTMGAILASKINKKSDQTHSLPVAAAAGIMGLLNQSPLGNVVEGASQLSDPRSAEWAMGEHVKGLVDPQLSQEIAQWMDKNAQGKVVKRDPKTITQHIETGIPVLRNKVPAKAKQ